MSPDMQAAPGAAARHRVLLDLTFGTIGFSGIPQDTRLMFSTFAHAPEIEVTGLLMSMNRTIPKVVRREHDKQLDTDLSSALMLNDIFTGRHVALSGLRRPRTALKALLYFRHLCRQNPALWSIPMDILSEPVWRQVFARSLPSSERPVVLRQRFLTGPFSLGHITDRTVRFPFLGPLRLDTSDFDFAIFQDSRRVQVSPKTWKLIRYHDPIPVTQPDTMDGDASSMHLRAIRACARDSFYVCNSEPVREELVRLEPRLATRSATIPYRIEQDVQVPKQEIPPLEIVRTRLSLAAFGTTPPPQLRGQIEAEIASLTARHQSPRYIMAVSTLEPRKNFIGVIRAWERMLYARDDAPKLVIVGKPGWHFKPILEAMRPRVASGQLWHLEDCSFSELQALYRQAECVVFPSFAEGFGFPPVEAMVFGTPAVVSDLRVHRWVMEDAVLYADPYDIGSIAEQIERLVYGPDRDALRAELRQNARRVLARYQRQTIENHWGALFDELKAKGQPRA